MTPAENVSRPRRTPRDASSTTRTGRPGATSATTRRIALAPMSRTAMTRGVGAEGGSRLTRDRGRCSKAVGYPENSHRPDRQAVKTMQQTSRGRLQTTIASEGAYCRTVTVCQAEMRLSDIFDFLRKSFTLFHFTIDRVGWRRPSAR